MKSQEIAETTSWQPEPVRHLRELDLPEPGRLAGYAALIEHYQLRVPLPPRLALIATRHHKGATGPWLILTPRHRPADTLATQLEFALKYEGVDLAVMAALFRAVPAAEVAVAVRSRPASAYMRRLWFLHEWITGSRLPLDDLTSRLNYVSALDPEQQFAIAPGQRSARQRVFDNLPGTPSFCPLIRRTPALTEAIAKDLAARARAVLGRTHADVRARAAAFLLLKDSKASFTIEGEHPPRARVARWGQAIAQAGARPADVPELERLQRVVLGDRSLGDFGLRKDGGFIGDRDRTTNEPLPVHISARAEDLSSLMGGLAAYEPRALAGGVDPVVVSAALAFGFVYIHPFADGNGRIHRWLIHHALAMGGYAPHGVVFPVSAVILRQLETYRRVLESVSVPLLSFIDWEPTANGNVRVLNDTADYYRFFDATAHAEFIYACVEQTVDVDLPAEVEYLTAFEEFAHGVQEIVEVPQRELHLLRGFLAQNGGALSRRAREREYAALTHAEVTQIEDLYARTLGALSYVPHPPVESLGA